MNISVLDRFLKYVSVGSQSDADSRSVPSTPGQTELARLSLMLELVDLQHLRIKQLEETQASLLNSLEQMQEINNYRVRGELAPPLPKSELDQLLGL